jgi:uncharacterized repeat protein (TIGR02543 family)
LDSLDNIHIVYYDHEASQPKHAVNVFGSWSIETAGKPGDSYCHAAIDSLDSLHISAYNMYDLSLVYATAGFRPIVKVNTVGQGAVNLNPPGQIYLSGTGVTLTAAPDTGWAFSSWSGDLSGSTNPEILTMDAHKEVTATFVEAAVTQYTLTVNTSGSGSVILNPSGGTYDEGTVVDLIADPTSGWQFSGWGGDLSGSTNPTTITMDANKTVTATFVENQPPDPPTVNGPIDESVIGESDLILLDSGTYQDPEGDTHFQTHWEVWRADSGEIVYQDTSTINKEQLTLPEPLAPGLKYEWQVGYEDEAEKISWSEVYSFKVGTSVVEALPEITAGETVVDFGMISIIHWPDDPSPRKVFKIRYDPRYYKIGTYDPVAGQYIEFSDGLEIEPGRSYWMLAREGLSVNFNGIPVSKAVPIEVCLHHNGSATAPDGWNMIAPPNDANYRWGVVEVGVWNEETSEFIAAVPISTLADDTIIDRRVWEWNAGTYVSYMNNTDFVLERYKGYWVKSVKEGAYLVFPDLVQIARFESSNGVAVSKTRGVVAKDGDAPPMPMGALEDNETDRFFSSGCFVEILNP